MTTTISNYDEAIDYILSQFKAEGWFIRTFKGYGIEFNVDLGADAKYALVYETESGYYFKGAYSEKDLEILSMFREPYEVVEVA